MTLEWLRRRDPVLDSNLRTYLFTMAPVTDIEGTSHRGAGRRTDEPSASSGPGGLVASGGLGIGSLRGQE